MLSLSLVFLESAEGSPLPSSPVVPPGVAAFRDLPCVLRRTLCRRRWTGLDWTGLQSLDPDGREHNRCCTTVMRCARMQPSSGSDFRGRPFRNYDSRYSVCMF
jgi:hypothetical protein